MKAFVCLFIVVALAKSAVPQCQSDQFNCGDGRCIYNTQRCDGIIDCNNGLDEQNCTNANCAHDQFRCRNDGTCIPLRNRCDSKYDCRDLSDEIDCPCKPTDFRCKNNFCIPANLRCNGVHNCQDRSDEIGCPSGPSSPRPVNCLNQTYGCDLHYECLLDEFKCGDGICLNIEKRCNDVRDCANGADELNCDCPINHFRCKNGECIDEKLRCDNVYNCRDTSDEQGCRGEPRCEESEFECTAGFCIMGYKRCNGIKDCPSGNDEDNCPNPTYPEPECASTDFRCDNGQCISKLQLCDDVPDCSDQSDEIDCDYIGGGGNGECTDNEVLCDDGTCREGKRCNGFFECADSSDERGCPGRCTPDQYRCDDGGCIAEHLRCDGTIHCSDGSDEQQCVFNCPEDQFRCTNGLCLDGNRRCDGYSDCSDDSDEQNCGVNPPQCTSSEFNCDDKCISISFRCDGFADCLDNADEQGCPAEECSDDEFDCGEKLCIASNLVCDRKKDCPTGADEEGCPSEPCRDNEFRCGDGQCIPGYLVCSGTPECNDRSDEKECECRNDQFQCQNGNCIAGNLRCNRRNDCSDGSDEFNCPTERPPIVTEPPTRRPPINCSPGYQPCHSGDRCILRSQICDGAVDCNDMSDEASCPIPNKGGCFIGEFRCENGPCIRAELRCNGRVDCPRDSSDELDCPYKPKLPGPGEGLNLKTYPNLQQIKENREVVFQCRDEGPFRSKVHWTRPNGEALPPNSRDLNGRLEIPNIKVEHGGTYICVADGYPPNAPGAQVSVDLQVDRWIPQPTYNHTACRLHEATCSNGDCISKQLVCDGRFDCTDGSDESRCNPNGCEPNEFRCANKKCVLKTWKCDGDDDCLDGSDEDNCATNPPGSLCAHYQFACLSGNQCIPKSYHCDLQRDCIDGSDEIGCSLPVVSKPPPPMVTLDVGTVFEISCTAVGVPTPEVVWRLNWGHIPPKCRTTSINGVGTLLCPDIQIEDQGAYSCEVINIKGTVFAVPDTILMVQQDTVCPAGYFNEQAHSESECIKCFCFGQSNKCRSADLFIYQFQPPFDTLKLLGVRVDPQTGAVEIRDEPIYSKAMPQLSPIGRNGVHSQLPPYAELTSRDLVPYFAMPENYHGNQLKSYGGYLRFEIRQSNFGYSTPGPTIILTGNGYTLLSKQVHTLQPNRNERVEVRFFTGEWVKRNENYQETLATREEIMMTLANIDNLLIKLQYNDGPLNTTLSNIEMESAAVPNSGLGPASYVEECECPVGYSGASCEQCADGFERHRTGPWLGQCQKAQQEICPAGTYGDPSRGRPCEVCPCPLTNPSNQFARTCSLGSDGDVTCDCPPGYVGRRCEQCASGYTGNPLLPGDYCRPYNPSTCNSVGTSLEEGGRCRCKDYVEGPTCSSCQANTFFLNSETQFGCISCFCMGITRQCTSSNWYRDQVSTSFTTSRNNFKLINTENRDQPIEAGISLDQNRREITYSNFPNSNVHYWSLPPRYLGNKITSYGGFLRYTLRYVPLPGGQSSRNSAADVELVSSNQINLLYYSREQIQPSGSPQTFVVPLLEQYWQRSDGQKADREHLLMALADLEAIYIKATYNTNTRESALTSVSLDIAGDYNTGSSERALAVEQCLCPPGYKGLSCEDCAAGYTRADEGIYLGLCEPCNCNGNSNECDAETGVCFNCKNFTTGSNCESCLPGYEGDPANRIPCRYIGNPQPCNCNSAGSISSECYNGLCQCRGNVEGNNCDHCRSGTFGLDPNNIDGCQVCFCSGVGLGCREGSFFYEQIPTEIIDLNSHGFTLTDQHRKQRIETEFTINPLMNEIGYTFRPSNSERWYWALPRKYSGNQIMSYGGRLEFTQRYTQRPQAIYVPDQDVIITGNGITIYWTNPQAQAPNIANKIVVRLNPTANWNRIDGNQGPRPASREDIITALANVEVILIRAQQSSDTESSFLSDVTLDTAIEQNSLSPQQSAIEVEVCRCPPGYRGTSCEACAPGYYRDPNDLRTGPLGSCSICPCSNHEQSCNLGSDNRVICNCLEGYVGRECQYSVGKGTLGLEITPSEVIAQVGTNVMFSCKYTSMEQLEVRFLRDGTVMNSFTSHGIEMWSYRVDDCLEHYIQCQIVTFDRKVVGVVTAVINPANITTTTPGPWVSTERPLTIEITINAPKIEIYTVGSTVRFNCSATSLIGRGPVRVQWTKDGAGLPEHALDDGYGLLVITDLRASDSGRYICEASDGWTIESKDIVVTVGPSAPEPPRVVISPSFVDVQEGQPIQIQCAASGTPQPRLSLIRIDRLPLNPDHYFENGLFRINQARRSDQGPYQCIATNEAGSHFSNVEIYVRENSEVSVNVYISPQRFDGNSGDNFSLQCQTDRPTAIKWSKQGVSLPYNSIENQGRLQVNSARPEDSGTYVCTASISGQTATATTEVIIRETSTGFFPTAKVTPERITIAQGTSTELTCETTGSPAPIIKWTRVGSELPSHFTQNGPILYIRNAQISDRGVYVCVTSNTHGLAQASAVVEVNRLEVPILSIYPKPSQTVVAGNSAFLQCRLEAGIPVPTLSWTRENGASLSPNIEKMSDGTLRFTQITPSEAGEYICTAVNEAGRSTAIANIVVQVAPSVRTIPSEDVIMRRQNEYIRLECHATGTPPPSVQWRKQSDIVGFAAPVPPGSAEVRRDLAVLEIARFSAQDEGLYICEARNDAGTAEKRVQLVIDSVPSRGDIVGNRPRGGEDSTGTNNEVTPDGDYKTNERYPPYVVPRLTPSADETFTAPVGTRAELRCSVTKNDSEAIFVSWVRSDNTSLPSNAFVHGGTLYIDNVQPSAQGEYRCIGTHPPDNRVVFSVTAHLEVVSPPRITLNPPRQVVHPGDNAYIECSATGQKPITISWVPVGRTLPSSVVTRDGLIQFNNIQLSDAGRYRCSAVNSAGEADAVADVIVEENIHRPALTAENRQQNAPVGSSVTLRCRAHDPRVVSNIRWFRERLPLPSNTKINGEYLHLVDLQIEDAGRYYCEIPAESGSVSDYIDLKVTWPASVTTAPPSLHITPPEESRRVGDYLDITCQSSEPGVITTWSKLGGWLAPNIQNLGGTLRITSLRPENDGTYRCEATGHQGIYHKDYNLSIADEHVQDEAPIEVKTAPQGSTILMECKTDLEQPVSYVWSRQGKALRNDIDIYSRTIQLNDISGSDAGTYVCTQFNGKRKIETPTILTVTGVVPYFAQAPTSYLALQSPFPDPFVQINFEISFKPQSGDGLILYNGNKGNDKNGDFISLALVNGVPEFRYNLGYGVTIVKADKPVTINQWHTVKLVRYRKKATMFVDSTGPFIGNADGKYFGLDLSEPLYIGGVPNTNEISPEIAPYSGFVGCISRFKVDFAHKDITKHTLAKHGITSCETCSENKCSNQGVCQESLSPEGYYCICPAGYSGATCNKLKGEACSSYACGNGRCVDTENSFECLCPLGRAGRRCEREITINEPAFSNGAYIAYPPLKTSSRRFKVSLKLKANNGNDGVLLYSGETDEGYGDFVSLAVRNRHLEFTFNAGGRITTIRSEKEVVPGSWHVLTAVRSLSEGRLIIDGETAFGSTPRNHKVLNLITPLFVGGYDKEHVKINDKVGVQDGFNGCISEVDVSDMDLEIVNSAIDAANVGECSAENYDVDNNIKPEQTSPSFDPRRTGCSNNPCKNGGQCYPLSPIEYTCNCLESYTGKNCEARAVRRNICEELTPCQNGGSCKGNTTQYECNCVLGYTGTNCEQKVQLRNDVNFDGNGYLEIDRYLLDHSKDDDDEVIAFEISTNTSNGLIFWHGQTPNEDGQGQDYISLGINSGFLEFSYDLGSGPAIIRMHHIRVDDGQRHSVILKRRGRKGSIEVDNTYVVKNESPGVTTSLNTIGNIYLGGTPNIELMTGSKFNHGFNGCIHGFEVQNSKTIDLSQRAISGVNVKPCSSFDDDYENDFGRNDLVN